MIIQDILSTVINRAFECCRKTVLQTVSTQKRFAKSFYKSANYDGGKNNCGLALSKDFPRFSLKPASGNRMDKSLCFDNVFAARSRFHSRADVNGIGLSCCDCMRDILCGQSPGKNQRIFFAERFCLAPIPTSQHFRPEVFLCRIPREMPMPHNPKHL